jgi:hypothetical protein
MLKRSCSFIELRALVDVGGRDTLTAISQKPHKAGPVRLSQIHATAALVGKGVARHRNRWRTGISDNGKHVHLGYFPTYEAAHAAYLEAKMRLAHG